MILTIKNLGALKEAEIDLSKDLILLCGHNNTGKTYTSYLIYHFLCRGFFPTGEVDEFSMYYPFDESYTLDITDEILQFDILKFMNTSKEKERIIKAFLERNSYKQDGRSINIERLFLGNKDFLEYFDYSFDYEINDTIKNNILDLEINETYFNDFYQQNVTLKKEKGVYTINFITKKPKKENTRGIDVIDGTQYVHDMLAYYTYSIIGFPNIFSTYMFTSERSAINIFSKELSLNKNRIFGKILKSYNVDKSKLLEIAEKNVGRYPQPITDSLEIAEDLANLSNKDSSFAYLAEELEQSILKGKIVLGQYGDLRYLPNNGKVALEIHQTSSLVKSLASLVFYLRHLAQKKDCIIIDEPELNLHPNNQILVARFLARLVNEGFKIIASTHSDYIIRELSNLLMLSNSFGEKEELMKMYGYNENELLKNEQVGVYYFENGKDTVVNVPLLKRGIEIDSINEVITDLNERSDNIYYTFLESDENKAAEKEEESLKNKSKI